MAEELNLAQMQKMEAIKLLSDWSKWLITIETGGIAGIVSFLDFKNFNPNSQSPGLTIASVILAFASILFVGSIWSACLVLLSLPRIAELVPDPKSNPELSIYDMRDEDFQLLKFYAGNQYKFFVAGLALVAASILAWVLVP
jgi:hypothetical protein